MGAEARAQKELTGFTVAVMGRFLDEKVLITQVTGNRGDDADGIRAGDGQYVRVFRVVHWCQPL